jgi:hypothetical protein
MDAELRKVQTVLTERLRGDDSSDYWAAGDLAMVSALLGDTPGMKKGLAMFTASATPGFAYDAYVKTLGKLLASGHPQAQRCQNLLQKLERAKLNASM